MLEDDIMAADALKGGEVAAAARAVFRGEPARRGAPALRNALPHATAPPRIAPLTPAPVPTPGAAPPRWRTNFSR